MFSTGDGPVSKDFMRAIARAGGEEVSPQDQFATRPIPKACLNTEVAHRGTAGLQHPKA